VSELTRIIDDKGDHYALTNSKVNAGDQPDADPSNFRPFLHGAGDVKSFIGKGAILHAAPYLRAITSTCQRLILQQVK